MKNNDSDKVLQLLIEYFETGNTQTDAVAKIILQSSSEYKEYWSEKLDQFQNGIEWTGIRTVEAEILTTALRQLQKSHAKT